MYLDSLRARGMNNLVTVPGLMSLTEAEINSLEYKDNTDPANVVQHPFRGEVKAMIRILQSFGSIQWSIHQ